MSSTYAAGVRHTIDPEQIVAITGDINYSFVHYSNGQYQLHSRTLKWFHDRFPGLVRIHKNALINTQYVHDYHLKSGRKSEGFVLMKNNLRLDVSRRNVKPLSALFTHVRHLQDLDPCPIIS